MSCFASQRKRMFCCKHTVLLTVMCTRSQPAILDHSAGFLKDWSRSGKLGKCHTHISINEIMVIHSHKIHPQLGQVQTRRSENDNTPQPLDQWKNSPCIGQQVGNCTSFTLTHYLADLFALAQGRSHCASNIISNTHPFHSNWVDPPIPEIRLFQNLTLKIQGEGHGRGEHWKSHHGSNILSTHIPLVPCKSATPFICTTFSKFDLENPRSRSWFRGTLSVTT